MVAAAAERAAGRLSGGAAGRGRASRPHPRSRGRGVTGNRAGGSPRSAQRVELRRGTQGDRTGEAAASSGGGVGGRPKTRGARRQTPDKARGPGPRGKRDDHAVDREPRAHLLSLRQPETERDKEEAGRRL